MDRFLMATSGGYESLINASDFDPIRTDVTAVAIGVVSIGLIVLGLAILIRILMR